MEQDTEQDKGEGGPGQAQEGPAWGALNQAALPLRSPPEGTCKTQGLCFPASAWGHAGILVLLTFPLTFLVLPQVLQLGGAMRAEP